MPNALLARYFLSRGLFADVDFHAMNEGDPEALFSGWLDLSDPIRNEIDAELRDIFTMCCEKGFLAILDEARWQLRRSPESIPPLLDELSALPNHFERAMVAFLEHQEFWKGATRFYHADMLSYWRKRKNLPHRPAAVDPSSIQQLANMIRRYFRHTEGRGRNCVVEPYRRNERDYFFCYPEDHSQRSIEWVDGKFDPRPHNPAFEIIYVYSQSEGTLDLNFRGSYKAIEPLQSIFATAILKLDDLPPDPKDSRVYDLAALSRRSFAFTYSLSSGIENVAVKKLRLSSRIVKGDRITVEADISRDPDAVYDLLEEIGKSISLNLYSVTQVELAASVVTDVDKPPKSITIRLTYPNSCSLKYDEIDLKLRDMLEASGIEPKVPSEDAPTLGPPTDGE
jgi:hypothetical protein